MKSIIISCCIFAISSAMVYQQKGSFMQMEQEIEMVGDEASHDQAVIDMIQYWKHLEELHSDDPTKQYRTGPLKLQGFSWSDCGAGGDPVHVTELQVGPDPVKLPGQVTVTAHGSIGVDLVAPVQVSLEVHKRIIVWVKIPCIKNIGSCTYADACALNPFKDKPCPPIFQQKGLTCKCPVKSGTYKLDQTTFTVPSEGVPSWLEDGDYRITAHLSRGGKDIGCINVAFSLSK